jgi:hypothetical protein
MELIEKNISNLFAQLGEATDEVGMANFIKSRRVYSPPLWGALPSGEA